MHFNQKLSATVTNKIVTILKETGYKVKKLKDGHHEVINLGQSYDCKIEYDAAIREIESAASDAFDALGIDGEVEPGIVINGQVAPFSLIFLPEVFEKYLVKSRKVT